MKNIEIVLKYVKASIANEVIAEPVSNSVDFYRIVFENGLVGLVYGAMKSNVLQENVFKRMEKDFFGYLKKDRDQMAIISEVTTRFVDNDIHYLLLKGSHLKKLYRESYQRGMGDFDVLVLKTDYEKAQKVLKQGYELMSVSLGHTVFLKNNVMVEVHPLIETRGNSKFDPLLKDIDKYLIKDNLQMQFKPEFELLYLIYHLEKHLKSGGIGLRSVLDIGIFLKAYEQNIDNELLNSLVDKLQVKTFVQTMIALNDYLFAIKSNLELMSNYEMDLKLMNDLTNHIVKVGVHGTGSNFNEFSVRVISEGKKGRIRFLMSRLFPSVKEMKGFYPVLNKVIILIPFCYIARFFKIVIFRGRSNWRKLKQTKKVDVANEQEIIDLFTKIEII